MPVISPQSEKISCKKIYISDIKRTNSTKIKKKSDGSTGANVTVLMKVRGFGVST
jgi:hypothetical protein